MWEDIKAKRGCLEITRDALFEDEEVTKAIMSNMVIVRAETLMMKEAVEYYAYSRLFRDIEPGEQIPRYLIEVIKNDDSTMHIHAREIKGK